jgi:hypothetical protein
MVNIIISLNTAFPVSSAAQWFSALNALLDEVSPILANGIDMLSGGTQWSNMAN